MAKTSLVQLPAALYGLLEPLTQEERTRVIQATLVLLGDQVPTLTTVSGENFKNDISPRKPPRNSGDPEDGSTFLDEKAPKTKGETLAVAARFLELTAGNEAHSKAELKAVFSAARRNFDDGHFARDMDNARRQAGLFNTGTGRDSHKLSYYGQQFVDALPDREAAAKIKRPRSRVARKKVVRKRASKK